MYSSSPDPSAGQTLSPAESAGLPSLEDDGYDDDINGYDDDNGDDDVDGGERLLG